MAPETTVPPATQPREDGTVFKDMTEHVARHRRSHHGRLFGGFVLIAVGVLFLLDELFLLDVEAVWDLWPLILVGLGVVKLTRPRTARGRGWGVFLIVLGGWLLFDKLGVVDARDSWPVLLMALGATMIVNSLRRRPDSTAS